MSMWSSAAGDYGMTSMEAEPEWDSIDSNAYVAAEEAREAAGSPEEPCSRHCGYFDSGRGLIDHERYEHRPCPECGAGNDDGQDEDYLRTYSLSHRQSCPRLQPGYVYR